MARIRTIKPEFFTSLTLATVSRDARLTFVGLWTYCDDDGRARDDARLVKAAVWPLDDKMTPDAVDRHLVELAEAGLIQRYTVEGGKYLAVRNWKEHQKIAHPTPSKHPAPPARRAADLADAPEDFVRAPETLVNSPDMLAPERKGKERKKESLSEDERTVVEHYRAKYPKRLRGEIPSKILRLLRVALESYPAADLCRAIDGNAASEFHRDNGHLGLDLILRDASKIDYFLDLAGRQAKETREMTDEYGRMRLHAQRDGWWGYEENGEWVRTIEVERAS